MSTSVCQSFYWPLDSITGSAAYPGVYPGSDFLPSRNRIKELFKYFNPKNRFLSSDFLPVPGFRGQKGTGSRGQKGTGSGGQKGTGSGGQKGTESRIRIRNTDQWYAFATVSVTGYHI
jgi:hypothetical protein